MRDYRLVHSAQIRITSFDPITVAESVHTLLAQVFDSPHSVNPKDIEFYINTHSEPMVYDLVLSSRTFGRGPIDKE